MAGCLWLVFGKDSGKEVDAESDIGSGAGDFIEISGYLTLVGRGNSEWENILFYRRIEGICSAT